MAGASDLPAGRLPARAEGNPGQGDRKTLSRDARRSWLARADTRGSRDCRQVAKGSVADCEGGGVDGRIQEIQRQLARGRDRAECTENFSRFSHFSRGEGPKLKSRCPWD